MYPPPTISRLLGTSFSASASVESITRSDCPSLSALGLGGDEGHPPRGRLARFVDEPRNVQQRLGWDAADEQTYPAGVGPLVDERDVEPHLRRKKSGGIHAGPRADDD